MLWTRFSANRTVHCLAVCFVEEENGCHLHYKAHVFATMRMFFAPKRTFEKQARLAASFVETTSKAHVWSLRVFVYISAPRPHDLHAATVCPQEAVQFQQLLSLAKERLWKLLKLF